jgi:hypothetical protein
MYFARFFLLLFGLSWVLTPLAQADDDFLFGDDAEEEEDVEIAPIRIDEADGEDDDDDLEAEEDELDALMGSGEADGPIQIDIGFDDEEDEEGDADNLAPGADTAALYRAQLEAVIGMAPDEEAMVWEAYLQTYPNSSFKRGIDERVGELSQAMFQGPRAWTTSESGGGRAVDNANQELEFSAGMLLQPIDPRSRLRAGFEWGYPSWINLIADYEHQIQRDLSVHGGISNRFTGWSLEGGARYAIIKSVRTNFIVTAMGDIRLNVTPVAPGFRPMIAAGKRFELSGESYVDVQAQVGTDLLFFPGVFSPRLLSGMNVTVAPSKRVHMFLEFTSAVKPTGDWDDADGNFRFNQVAFGLRFQGENNSTVGTGAAVPIDNNYWRYHYGAIMADYQYYM